MVAPERDIFARKEGIDEQSKMKGHLEGNRLLSEWVLESRKSGGTVEGTHYASDRRIVGGEGEVFLIELIDGFALQVDKVQAKALPNHDGHGQAGEELSGVSKAVHVMLAVGYVQHFAFATAYESKERLRAGFWVVRFPCVTNHKGRKVAGPCIALFLGRERRPGLKTDEEVSGLVGLLLAHLYDQEVAGEKAFPVVGGQVLELLAMPR